MNHFLINFGIHAKNIREMFENFVFQNLSTPWLLSQVIKRWSDEKAENKITDVSFAIAQAAILAARGNLCEALPILELLAGLGYVGNNLVRDARLG